MAYNPEQICRAEKAVGYKRFLKKTLRRFRRRQEKAMLEDAPKKAQYRGWTD